MSNEKPKRVEELTAWFHREFANCTHWTNSSQCEAWADQFARTSGWVSPEEAEAREDAARREALLPFAKLADNLDKAAEWNELSVRERKERWPEDLAHGVSRPSASLRARTLLRKALAEPERDEEPCSCGSRDATSLTPGEWLHHSPDGCTIERDDEGGR